MESVYPWERLKSMAAFLVNSPSFPSIFPGPKFAIVEQDLETRHLLDLLTVPFGFGSMPIRPTDQDHAEADHNSRKGPHISQIARTIFAGRELVRCFHFLFSPTSWTSKAV